MILKRKIYNDMLRWKSRSNGTSALLIEGARRIGKSFVSEKFGENEYESHLKIDFSTAPPHILDLFTEYLDDIDTLLNRLQLHYRVRLSPRKSLVIFDEIQFCPRARAAIKHLVADGRFDYIETGSLISIKQNVKDILIPSEEEAIKIYPLDYEEFLWAVGEPMLMDFIREQFSALKPMGSFHRRAMDRFREYMIVGGMPQSVVKYIETNNFDEVDSVKRQIISLYRNDIRKYAGGESARALSIFDEIPGQLQKHEKKFRLAALGEEARMREYSDAFMWLSEAMVVNLCYNSTAPNIGLRLNEERTTLKCYLADTGLLISLAFDEHGIAAEDIYRKLMFDKLEVNSGMILENVIAQMLQAAGHKLYFFSQNDREDAANTMEIDFLIAKSRITSRHNISPIEVKSGKNYTFTSLKKCITKFGRFLSTPYLLHDKDVSEKDGVILLPVYMAPLL